MNSPSPTGSEAEEILSGPIPAVEALKRHSKIKYRIEYVNKDSKETAAYDITDDTPVAVEQTHVFEYVDVRVTDEQIGKGSSEVEGKKKYSETCRGHAYIRILSPAVNEALRCVVDYYPGVDLSGSVIVVKEPFAILVFHDEALSAYRDRLKPGSAGGYPSETCGNRYAYDHIGLLQEFVRERMHNAVEAERERHRRGVVTFNMLWLLYKPGCEVYMDPEAANEHEPSILSSVIFSITNGSTKMYSVQCWNLLGDFLFIGPSEMAQSIAPFAGEKSVVSLPVYPCEFLKFNSRILPGDSDTIRKHFVERGRKWYSVRRKPACYAFDGQTASFPRTRLVGLVMCDDDEYLLKWAVDSTFTLTTEVAHSSSPLVICSCTRCDQLIYKHAVKPRFGDYVQIRPAAVEELTDDQYFICDRSVTAFVFKTREWQELHISGFQDPVWDKSLLDSLVIKDSTKQLIRSLTSMYLKHNAGEATRVEDGVNRIDLIAKPLESKSSTMAWSADFISGKGEGLTFLLHGKPGVGKTYTAECISQFAERPLLSLTCTDIGVEVKYIESNLKKWFELAEKWGAVLLVDEADIYMEQRQIQDIERNHLVAGFLRALEYYRGILFLTTNRVGTFDEAFVSRIHIQIHYGDFTEEDRERVWNLFFEKLENDRETTMRITQAAKDYTQSDDVKALNWNGREIRNAFQVAVALAESQGQKDPKDRVLIKPDHIKASVQMSKEFKGYLTSLYKQTADKRAAAMGNRYDAFDSPEEEKKKKGPQPY